VIDVVSEKLFTELNEQLNFELYSAYIYAAMASYAQEHDFDGFANFFKVQVREEMDHVAKLYDFIFQKNGVVEFDKIDKPINTYSNVLDLMETAYIHEQLVTSRIYKLVDLANEEKEHSTSSLLRWFVDEQVEEEDNFSNIVKKIKRAEGNQVALYMLDDELSKRVYTPPTTQE
jgi:ferritin